MSSVVVREVTNTYKVIECKDVQIANSAGHNWLTHQVGSIGHVRGIRIRDIPKYIEFLQTVYDCEMAHRQEN